MPIYPLHLNQKCNKSEGKKGKNLKIFIVGFQIVAMNIKRLSKNLYFISGL
jgi:hypothetical protein